MDMLGTRFMGYMEHFMASVSIHYTSLGSSCERLEADGGVVMSRNSGYSEQVVELDFLYPSEGIHRQTLRTSQFPSTHAEPLNCEGKW
uniref:DUF7477 domain-containing protein n=1 Tax=Brassica campestris TaxID=3711 RepID=A0A3P5ZH93_BRACM|nr:unnamed protein product [Brassica rapa]